MKIRPPRTGRKSKVKPRLDRSQIVQAALDLLDAVGFDGLTMRNLAKKLGIKAASLYWHVRNKQDLLSLLADEICASMREPDRTLPWRKQAMGTATSRSGCPVRSRRTTRNAASRTMDGVAFCC